MLNNCILLQIASRCVCVFVVGVCMFVVGVCVCFCMCVCGRCVYVCGRCVCVFLYVCLLVVSNASMIDLLLYVTTVGKIEIWNQWFEVQF